MGRIFVGIVSCLAAQLVLSAPFQNGSFELGPGPGPCFATLPSGSTSMTGWTVIQGDVDWYGPSCSILPSSGNNSVDLIGDQSKGGVQQTFDTVPGATYQVQFDLNGNYGAAPVVKPLTVTVAGVVQNYTFDTTGENLGNFLSRYATKTFSFVANSTSATITFVSDTTGQGTNAGAVIDNVRVAQLSNPIPLTWAHWAAAGLLAFAALAYFSRRRGRSTV